MTPSQQKELLDRNLSGYTWTNDDKSVFFAFFNGEVWFIIPNKEVFNATYSTYVQGRALMLKLAYTEGNTFFKVKMISEHRMEIEIKDEKLKVLMKKVAGYQWI